jgi:hypothetical protein
MSDQILWKLNGTNFKDLGIEDVVMTRRSLAPDECLITVAPERLEDADLLSADQTATITRQDVDKDEDPVIWFRGIHKQPGKGSQGGAEQTTYRLLGPWYWLGTVYRQRWKVLNPETQTLEWSYSTRVNLNQDEGGNVIPTDTQIQLAAAYALSVHAGVFQLGVVEPSIDLPMEEAKDIKCAEVIIKMLRMFPNASTWFDYTTEPPTLNVTLRDTEQRPALTFPAPVGDADNTAFPGISLRPRYDLVKPGFHLTYEQTDTVDGLETTQGVFATHVVDAAGDTGDPEAVYATIELAGSSTSYVQQAIKTEDWPEDLDDQDALNTTVTKEFLKRHISALKEIGDFVVIQAVRDGAEAHPRILTKGTIHEWMSGVQDPETETCTVTVSYTIQGPDGQKEEVASEDHTMTVTSTDARTRWYRRLESVVVGEPVPEGLADALLAAHSTLEYDGEIAITEDECSLTVHPGDQVNISNGPVEWSTMKALVQSVRQRLASGQTTMIVGPAKQLGPDDVLSLLRRFRNRTVAYKFRERTTGKKEDDGRVVALGAGAEPKDRNGSANKRTSKKTFTVYDTDGTTPLGHVELDPEEMTEHENMTVQNVGGVLTLKRGWTRAHG